MRHAHARLRALRHHEWPEATLLLLLLLLLGCVTTRVGVHAGGC